MPRLIDVCSNCGVPQEVSTSLKCQTCDPGRWNREEHLIQSLLGGYCGDREMMEKLRGQLQTDFAFKMLEMEAARERLHEMLGEFEILRLHDKAEKALPKKNPLGGDVMKYLEEHHGGRIRQMQSAIDMTLEFVSQFQHDFMGREEYLKHAHQHD